MSVQCDRQILNRLSSVRHDDHRFYCAHSFTEQTLSQNRLRHADKLWGTSSSVSSLNICNYHYFILLRLHLSECRQRQLFPVVCRPSLPESVLLHVISIWGGPCNVQMRVDLIGREHRDDRPFWLHPTPSKDMCSLLCNSRSSSPPVHNEDCAFVLLRAAAVTPP